MNSAMNLYLVIIILLGTECINAWKSSRPEQIHLSLGGNEREMVVTWTTMEYVGNSISIYGRAEAKTLIKLAKASTTLFEDGGKQKRKIYIHRTSMTGLKPGREYVYRVGSDEGGWSEMYSFRTLKSGSRWSPTIAVVGDLGLVGGVSTPTIEREVRLKKYDAVFHVGDIAYDMDSNNGKLGDAYMNQIQPFAANVPYMTCVGNHEKAYNFSHYKNRFTMPGGDGEGMFYSVNIGPVHLVVFSSEFYYFTEYGTHQIKNQYDWLEKDLTEANRPINRAKHPWIITMCHRPLYCSNVKGFENCEDPENQIRVGLPLTHEYSIEDLLYKHAVDIHFQGHKHSYERTWPVYNFTVHNGTDRSNLYENARAPIYIITGSGGNKEKKDSFVETQPNWSAFRSSDRGYTIMKVANGTHLILDQISIDQGDDVIDSIVVVKNARRKTFPRGSNFLKH